MSEVFGLLAAIGMMFGDLLAIASIIGSGIMLLGVFTPQYKFGEIAQWSILGLVFGGLGQISIEIMQQPVKQVGIFIPLRPEQVNALLIGSSLMLIMRGFIRKNR